MVALNNVFSTLSSIRQQQNRLIENVFGLLAYFLESLILLLLIRFLYIYTQVTWELKSYRLMKLSSFTYK